MNPSRADGGRDTGSHTTSTNPDRPAARATPASLLILTALWLVIYAAGMFTPPLLDDVDTIHAEAAREMLLRHDWVTLYTNGLRYLEKAPLMYWSLAGQLRSFRHQ